jgi:hypothetical protein
MSSTIEMTDMEDDALTFYARQQIWYQYAGTYYQRKCLYPWCSRMMNQDTFCVIYYDNTHEWDVTSIQNMRPVCDICYMNMRRSTMREWVDHMDYTYSVGTLRACSTNTPLSHGDAQSSVGNGDGSQCGDSQSILGTTSLMNVIFTNTPSQGDGAVYHASSNPPQEEHHMES